MTPSGNPPTGRPHARAVRLVLILLFANLALSIVFAGLTLLFRHGILDYQLARHPGPDPAKTRDKLALTLWTRPIPILLVAVVYLWVGRRLRQGVRAAYLRVRVVSLVGLVAVAYLILTGAYPPWLRVIQGAQLLLLVALVVAVNRRRMRTGFPRGPKRPRPRGARRAAFTLVLIAPVAAELTLGTVKVKMLWLVLLYLPIYGAGVLLIRELVRRTGGGRGSILLMGLVYGLIEEGLALQSLTSPHLYGAAGWAPRLLGVNTAYTELNLPYHVVFSVLIPIALVELVFPTLGSTPYLRRGGLVITGIVAVLGVALLRVSVPPSEDPGYVLPGAALIVIVVLVVVLSVVALRVLPRRAARVRAAVAVPRPAVAGVVSAVAALGFIGLLYPFAGARHPAFTHGAWVLVPMLAAAALAVGAGLALWRWTAAADWTSRHRLAAISGALIAHTVFGVVANTHTVPDTAGLTVIGVVMIVLLVLLGRRLDGVPPAEPVRARAARS
ncbi:hypothetical protein [Actinoallomurus sp. CA-142502]|uniref:hypothetical protein n=1 Tax=Actinoallomurus sp. CA-142502 TaxID=3239885 RepID=UPI003D8CE06D